MLNALNYQVGDADIKAVSWGPCELVQRIFITVRDRDWREIAPARVRSDVGARNGLTLGARHTSDRVDFEWRGSFHAEVGEGAHLLRFAFEGYALRDMEICRVGLVVLHPLIPLIGGRIRVSGPDGVQELAIPADIHPQPILRGVPVAMTKPFSQLTAELPDVGTVKLGFTGDLFEMEDQRNWGDASFKSYCTPLSRGFPRRVPAGAMISQGLEMEFVPLQRRKRSGGTRHAIRRAAGAHARLPRLGCWAGAPLETDDRMIRDWSHVRVDVEEEASAAAAECALAEVPSGTPIELCIATDESGGVSGRTLDLLAIHSKRFARVLLCGAGVSPPAEGAIAQVADVLGRLTGTRPPVFGTTRGYFVELNRGARFEGATEGVAFPLTATVHSDDASTIAENVSAIRDMARTARTLMRCSSVSISPLALHYPRAKQPQPFPDSLLAPWLLGTLAQAAAAGVCSVTLDSDLMSALTAPTAGGVLSMLGSLIAAVDRPLLDIEVNAGPRVHAIAIQRDDTRTADLFVANLNEGPVQLHYEDDMRRLIDGTNGPSNGGRDCGDDIPTVAPYSVVSMRLTL